MSDRAVDGTGAGRDILAEALKRVASRKRKHQRGEDRQFFHLLLLLKPPDIGLKPDPVAIHR